MDEPELTGQDRRRHVNRVLTVTNCQSANRRLAIVSRYGPQLLRDSGDESVGDDISLGILDQDVGNAPKAQILVYVSLDRGSIAVQDHFHARLGDAFGQSRP